MGSSHPPMESAAVLRRRRRRRVPDADRKRAPRACDRCRARKNKCVETASGVCVRCIEGAHPCRFGRERSPVLLPSAGGEESASAAEQRPASREGETVLVDTSLPPPRSIKDDFSPGGGSGGPTEAFMWPRFLSRLREAFCLDSDATPASGEPEDTDTTRPHAGGGPSRNPSPEPAERRRLGKAVRNFPPRPVAEFLLSVCITYGTDIFFYFDQAQLTHDLALFYADEHARLRADAGFVCLVLAVFALGSHWTSLAKPSPPAEEADEDEDEEGLPEDVDPGRVFYNQARTLMADLIDRPCLRSVQAAYVLGVYLMPASAISASYVYMGLALRKALAIGLHLEPDDPVLGEDEKEMRRRLWWSIYSLERTVTIKLNRPRSISQDIITARLPRPTSRDRSQSFDNVQHQIANARLVRIIDNLSEPASWPCNTGSHSTMIYDDSLKAWKRSLPASLRLQNTNPSSPSYRAVFHLHLNYYFARIDMGKVPVVTVVRARLRALFRRPGENPNPDANANANALTPAVQNAADACVRAAKKMLELFEGLSRGGNMARFSFTDLQGCSIATIVVLLAGILDRDAAYEGRVAFGLQCLRRMAGGGNATAGMGVRFVEALRGITEEARAKLLRSQAAAGRGGHGSLSSLAAAGRDAGYGQWAEWIANAGVAEDSSDDEDSDSESEELADVGSRDEARDSLSPAWDAAAALQLQELSASGFEMPLEEPAAGADVQDTVVLPPMDESWLGSFAWNDDQMYLMGLTGMDVLDFTGGFE